MGDGERRKKYSAAVIDGIKRKSRIFVGDCIVRKTDSRLTKGRTYIYSSLSTGSKNRACQRERVEKIMGRGNGGSILVHIGTNNADKEGTTSIMEKYRNLLKKTKQARVGQIILSGILPVFGNKIHGYRNSKRMAVGKEEIYARDGLHLSGKGAAVFADGLSGAVASGLGKVRYLN